MRLGRRWLVMLTVVMLLIATVGIGATPGLAANSPSTRLRGINLDTTTIPRLQQLMNAHRLTSAELVRFYLRRIDRLNPKLHAVITVSRTAVADARAADRYRRKHGAACRPLLGIPVIVKDNIDTTGMPTTAGSLALAGSTPAGRLHRAAAARPPAPSSSARPTCRSGPTSARTQSSSGWSAVGGQTEQPVRARPQPLRVELRAPPSSPRPTSPPSRRHRDRRLDRLPVRRERRSSASSRPSVWPAAAGIVPDLRPAGHRRPDRAQRHRRRRPARRS